MPETTDAACPDAAASSARHPDSRHLARLAVYGRLATRLSLMSDRRLGEAVAAATPLGAGIGGRPAELDVDGTRVFVKRVPLTDLELRPENVRSTANLFGLPTFYQYGVGSAGFGAWRELAAHTITTNWVLADAYADFPLMYHWRVLPDSAPEGVADEFGGIDGAVAHWEGSSAVRTRLEAIARSSASLVLFLEHVPQTLAQWLNDRREAPRSGGDGPPYAWVDESLARGAEFMSSRGFVHFDAHFRNVLTDGRSICFADLGLALSSGFELSEEESGFLAGHLAYDRHYVANHLLRHHVLDTVRGDAERDTFLRGWIAGERPEGVPPGAAALIDRHARPSVVLDGFHHRLLNVSKRTPYPAADIDRAGSPKSSRGHRAGGAEAAAAVTTASGRPASAR
ncbi:protein kinase family protein [Streptomyces sp. NBC_00876]|uniref:protein kinase family protein n=1 Tax=Streptomyces sp. NBC_00876 TaxID=2975853 RepID=UPI00386A7E9F|nr:protein kinase family protein [Streptomyces sp. NBC_00876]